MTHQPAKKRNLAVGAVKKRKPTAKRTKTVADLIREPRVHVADESPAEQLFEIPGDNGFPIYVPLNEALARLRSQNAVFRNLLRNRYPLCKCPFCWLFRFFAPC